LKNRNFIPLISSIFVILVLLITGCTPQDIEIPIASPTPTQQSTTSTPAASPTPITQTIEVEKKFNVLSPQGIQLPVDTKPLANRLDALDGKIIYVNQGEADAVIMPALFDRLKKDYPKTTWKLIASASFGPRAVESDVTKEAKAVIRGIGW
jgi:hypothetical protein